MKIINQSNINYKSASKRVSSDILEDICHVATTPGVCSLKYIRSIIPNSYKYKCQCQAAYYCASQPDTLIISDDWAKARPHGRGTHYLITIDPAYLDAYKASGWRLINRSTMTLVR